MIEKNNQEMAALGDLMDGMGIKAEKIGDKAVREALHERGRRHLLAYVKAMRIHEREVPDCGADPLCCGKAVYAALTFRGQVDLTYELTLLLTAIHMLAEQEERYLELAQRAMRLDLDFGETQDRLADLRKELDDTQARLMACESIVADDRSFEI